ncbi:hypothetical protein OCS_03683 [Ophiocordyceps sinensis CO18]|uniref:Uncharacterized protein n=1 Tax=Ophiocordyceps sinensis (strain Co18 / CGMCC 3.14243) TaxID=911162 RepID=T5A596_OPHSC|nr:hypothetical protein OCS_03683 [Ophiocordyceps sinensis CO18]
MLLRRRSSIPNLPREHFASLRSRLRPPIVGRFALGILDAGLQAHLESVAGSLVGLARSLRLAIELEGAFALPKALPVLGRAHGDYRHEAVVAGLAAPELVLEGEPRVLARVEFLPERRLLLGIPLRGPACVEFVLQPRLAASAVVQAGLALVQRCRVPVAGAGVSSSLPGDDDDKRRSSDPNGLVSDAVQAALPSAVEPLTSGAPHVRLTMLDARLRACRGEKRCNNIKTAGVYCTGTGLGFRHAFPSARLEQGRCRRRHRARLRRGLREGEGRRP